MAEKTVIKVQSYEALRRDEVHKQIGIYCRVSSTTKAQLRSMAGQVAGLTRFVLEKEHSGQFFHEQIWRLTDVYIDVATGKDNNREQYRRMLLDAQRGIINLVVVKSSSRLGRDTVEVIQTCRDLAQAGCDVYFQNADDFYSSAGPLIVEITTAVDHDENLNRSQNIRWGIRRSIEKPGSKLYKRVCYGYEQDENGDLIIREDQAIAVRKIFLNYLNGASVLKIKKILEDSGYPAPKGGAIWAKKTIDKILTNSKYTGTPRVRTRSLTESDYLKEIVWTDEKGDQYLLNEATGNNPPIITPEVFEKVQQMRRDRSNIDVNLENGTRTRKSQRYTSKEHQKLIEDNLEE